MAARKKAARKKAAKKAFKKGGNGFYRKAVSSFVSTKQKPQEKKARGQTTDVPASKDTSQRKRKASKDDFVKGLVFVAMSFQGTESDNAFSAIREECKSLGLQPRRVDEIASSGIIILDTIKLIEDAEFIIFDLSRGRPNVYYELGYAHGVGNSPENILLVAKKGTRIHFNIFQLRVFFYSSTEDLRKIVREKLKTMKSE